MWKLHEIRDEGVYNDLRYDRIRFPETNKGEPDLTPYIDPKSKYADIGVGFQMDANWDEILGVLGFDATADANFINEIKRFVGTRRKLTTETLGTLIDNLNGVMRRRGGARTIFGFWDAEEVKTAFDLIVDKNERKLVEWTTTRGIGFDRSEERIALLDLVYCNVIGFEMKDGVRTPKCPALLDALQYVNRPEAWFEIRYRSNKERSTNPDIAHGIAKRRYYESDLFNLYDPGEKTDEEMILEDKTIFSMYWRHKDYIEKYDKTPRFAAQISDANSSYRVDWVKSFADDVKFAKDDIISRFALGQSIDNVFVGKGLSTYDYLDGGDYKDILVGTDKADLIFGERGDDWIMGLGGNDVLYGGEGDDTYLISSNNLTYGTVTRIEDKEGTDNRVVIIGKPILRFVEQADGNVEYQYMSVDLLFGGRKEGNGDFVVTDIASNTKVILNEDFQEGDFGIRFDDELTPSDNPETSNVIEGDQDPENLDDALVDTVDNDLILCGAGDDWVSAYVGGEDWIKGDDGSDLIDGQSSTNCIIEGGADGDVLFGSFVSGSQIFADSFGDKEELIDAGETAQGTNQKGDLICGGYPGGDNFLYGSNGNDIVMAFSGKDFIVGGISGSI